MRALAVIRALAPIDAKSIRRDSYLGWVLLIPLGIAALVRWGVPRLSDWLAVSLDFDLAPYYVLITSYAVALMVPLLIGQLLGFLLLDERDDDTLTALLVTPLPLEDYLAYRIGLPLLGCTLLVMLAVLATDLVQLPLTLLGPIALLYALEAPMLTLLMASVCENKVQGFALVKAVGAVPLLSAAAYFLEEPWQYAAGVIPTFWPVKAFWLASEGSSAAFWAVFAAGLAVHVVILALLLRHFGRVLHR
jgi:fluoroquinolone transport system permease protein